MELMTPVYTNNSNIGQNFVATGDVTFSQILDNQPITTQRASSIPLLKRGT